MRKKKLFEDDPVEASFKVVGCDYLNLRADPSRASKVLAVIPRGTVLVGSSEGVGWVKVDYSGNKGYVREEYLKEEAVTSDE